MLLRYRLGLYFQKHIHPTSLIQQYVFFYLSLPVQIRYFPPVPPFLITHSVQSFWTVLIVLQSPSGLKRYSVILPRFSYILCDSYAFLMCLPYSVRSFLSMTLLYSELVEHFFKIFSISFNELIYKIISTRSFDIIPAFYFFLGLQTYVH